MEEFADIIEKIENQKTITPPDNLVYQIMVGVKKVESGILYKFNRFLFQPRELSSDAVSILSGKIISPRQCSFLLLIIGLFYLLMGLFALWGLKDVLSNSNINLWLRVQPYLSILSAVLIISMAVMVSQKPPTIIFAQYGIIAHTAFIVVNAFILEFMLFSPQALVFALVLTAAAIVFGVLLISSIRSFIKSGLLTTRSGYAQNT